MIRTIMAGLAGGMALNVSMVLTFRLFGFGWNGKGILLNPAVQSQKLITAWTTLPPLPLIVERPVFDRCRLVVVRGRTRVSVPFGISGAAGEGRAHRTLRLGGWIFVLYYLFWEFFTPFNQFGEPRHLSARTRLLWVTALSEAVAIVFVYERWVGHTR